MMLSSADPISPTPSDVLQGYVVLFVVSAVIVAVVGAFIMLRRRSINRS